MIPSIRSISWGWNMGIFYEPWGYVSSISANNWAYHWDGEFVNMGMSFEELGLKHQKIQIYITMTFLVWSIKTGDGIHEADRTMAITGPHRFLPRRRVAIQNGNHQIMVQVGYYADISWGGMCHGQVPTPVGLWWQLLRDCTIQYIEDYPLVN